MKNKNRKLAANKKSQRGVVYKKKFVFGNSPKTANNNNKNKRL
jgi:hypothetical protein